MRNAIAPLALAALLLGAGTVGADLEGQKIFLVYSSDERSELHPCG